MFKNWGKRDWVWSIIMLLFIIIIIIANKVNNSIVETNFSIVSSAASMALALLAIGYAFKQDSDNQKVNSKTQDILNGISQSINKVDNKFDLMNPLFQKTDEVKEEFMSILNKEENKSYTKEEVNDLLDTFNTEFKNTISNQINKVDSSIYSQQDMIDDKLENLAKTAFLENRDITTDELRKYIFERAGFNITRAKSKILLHKVQADDILSILNDYE